jgi:hypothetical protein
MVAAVGLIRTLHTIYLGLGAVATVVQTESAGRPDVDVHGDDDSAAGGRAS